jgi:hypothetical protein
MRTSYLKLPVIVVLATLACDAGRATDSGQPGGILPTATTIRAVNASASQLNLIVDGDTLIRSVQVGGVSAPAELSFGAHQIRLVSGATISNAVTVTAVDGRAIVAVGKGAASTGITSSVLSDTGAIVPATKSKLRVVHLSEHAGDIEIWRTQPDFPTPVHIMTPFVYGAESPYLQSDPGVWEVFVTAPGSTTKLTSTGPINIPAGQRRTVVLLDSAGNKRFRVIDE